MTKNEKMRFAEEYGTKREARLEALIASAANEIIELYDESSRTSSTAYSSAYASYGDIKRKMIWILTNATEDVRVSAFRAYELYHGFHTSLLELKAVQSTLKG